MPVVPVLTFVGERSHIFEYPRQISSSSTDELASLHCEVIMCHHTAICPGSCPCSCPCCSKNVDLPIEERLNHQLRIGESRQHIEHCHVQKISYRLWLCSLSVVARGSSQKKGFHLKWTKRRYHIHHSSPAPGILG
jgi:hypothetical protein